MLPSGLPETVGDDEDLARFLTSSSHFNASGARPVAFLPNPELVETSVFRHGEYPRESLWRISSEHLRTVRHVYGAAIVKARHVREALLEVVAGEPPARHANIESWPPAQTDPVLTKAAWMERALLVSQSQSTYVIRR